jgi:hypothetical protein
MLVETHAMLRKRTEISEADLNELEVGKRIAEALYRTGRSVEILLTPGR